MNALRIPIILFVALLVGCVGTRAAYQAAEDLEDTAFVMSEHYDALVVEGIRLRDTGALGGSALVTAQRLEARLRPLVLKMGESARAWEAVRSAENEAALQVAIADVTKGLHDLITALKAGRTSRLQRIETSLVEVAA